MDRQRWERVQALFHAACSLAPPERSAFLERECAGDAALHAEVLELLAEDERTGSPLDRSLADVAGDVLASPTRSFPEFIGPYRIRSLLGEGGMGVVYLGERADVQRQVAIKIQRDAWLSPARRARFASEQRLLARLEHPGIARLYDADTLPDGTPWFAMEYVEGTPITEYCGRGQLGVPARLQLFGQVCEAVQYAHAHLVVHRDLKPSNVLVRADGSVKLLDFGIARQLESLDGEPQDQTRTVLRLMTPAYAAPEQILGEPAGVQTDVYSLGVLLYELLTGRLPHDLSRLTPGEAERVVVTSAPERPSLAARRPAAGGAGVAGLANPPGRADWADLDVLCLTALARERERRYRTVEALARDVAAFRAGRPLAARPESLRYRTGKFLRRHRGPVALAAGITLLIVGLSGFYTRNLAVARNDALAQAARSERIQRFTMNLFDSGDDTSPPDSLRVVALVERGVEDAGMLDDEPAVQRDLLRTLGGAFHRLGKLERADSLLRSALERARAGIARDELAQAASLVALGLLRSDQARYDEAEAAVHEALGITGRRLPDTHPAALEAREALGHVLVERGEYQRAIAVCRDVVRLRTAAGSPPAELAGSIAQLAAVHFYAGDLAESDSLNVRALNLYRQVHGERHPLVAELLLNRGAVQQEQGRYVEAERFYRQALAIQRDWYGEEHPEVAATATMVARSLLFQERFAEADALLRRALLIRERVFGGMHPQVASTVNELGSIALQQDRYDEAEAAYRRMQEIYRVAYPRGHYLQGIATSNLASVYSARGDYRAAEPLFREAIDIYSATQGDRHLNTGIARIKLGRALLRQGRFAEAAGETRAGYEIVKAQADPGVSFLVAARTDLAIALDSLGRRADAEKMRQELAAVQAASSR